jgi:hypothetical protein
VLDADPGGRGAWRGVGPWSGEMMLCIEERDVARKLGPSGACGYTHYFTWPDMTRLGVFAHGSVDPGHPDYGNDSGQSCVFNDLQLQVICFRETPFNFLLRRFDDPAEILAQWNFTKADSPRHVLRSLGVVRVDDDFYACNWFDDRTTRIDAGLYRMRLRGRELSFELLSRQVTGNNIACRDGRLWIVSQTDDQLRIVSPRGALEATHALPAAGRDHYRGCVWIGDELLVSSADARRILVLDAALTVSRRIDMSPFAHDGRNHLPYGLWTAPRPPARLTRHNV